MGFGRLIVTTINVVSKAARAATTTRTVPTNCIRALILALLGSHLCNSTPTRTRARTTRTTRCAPNHPHRLLSVRRPCLNLS